MRKYLAEFLATFFLVFAIAGAAVADHQLAVVQVRDSFGPLGVALAYGLAFAAAIAAVAKISGGYANPAVSLALFVAGRLNAKDLMGYVAGQLLGGAAGAFLIKRLFVAQADQTGVGAPALGEQLTTFQGIAIEILLTFFLVLVIWGLAVDRKETMSGSAPLTIGFSLTTLTLIGAPFTGAAMNPARWFGSALAAGQLNDWPVWIVGPAVGALLAALLYESVFLTGPSEPGTRQDQQDQEPEGSETAAVSSPESPGAVQPAVTPVGPAVKASSSVPPAPASASPAPLPLERSPAEPAHAEPPAGQPPAPGESVKAGPGDPPQGGQAAGSEPSPPPPPPPPPTPAPGPQSGSGPTALPEDASAQKTPEQASAPGPESSEGEGA